MIPPRSLRLDDRDIAILAVLSREGRITKTDLAARVNLSPTPCWDRMRRLEQAGLIRGYRAQIDLAALGPHVQVFVTVELDQHRSESFQRFEAVIARVPLANVIYTSARKLLDILQTKPGSTQRVVLIDFPHRDMKSIGLVTRVLHEEGTGRELAAVYVPTTPNPTSGYLEVVPVELLTPTDWTVDQAMGFIISGGAVAPDSIPFTRSGERV